MGLVGGILIKSAPSVEWTMKNKSNKKDEEGKKCCVDMSMAGHGV